MSTCVGVYNTECELDVVVEAVDLGYINTFAPGTSPDPTSSSLVSPLISGDELV